MTVNVVVFLSG